MQQIVLLPLVSKKQSEYSKTITPLHKVSPNSFNSALFAFQWRLCRMFLLHFLNARGAQIATEDRL
jgi:hypothetical protein